MAEVNQEGSKPQVYMTNSNFSSLNFFKKPIFFIPIVLIILILALATLNYLNILPLSKLLSPSQTSTQIPTKGKALHPEEPILMPTPALPVSN